ncbi:hypothetical protein QBC38DRAFT_538687 [Podospora fimiseda]|uniref:Uncharacterized protein n=1 Tax=Podospora fimiseda TaxID=252190 RepID=A0AAN7BIS9_9PEZI|nr:hypothetical protein QBC38DRAFT_538687 [Podospora fimiseda]
MNGFAAGCYEAFGSAIGHHLWYRSLDNTVVQSGEHQAWSIRLGTAFAVLTKTSLVALIRIAAVQQMWATLRRKAMTLGGIDGMFNIMHDPTGIFNKDLLAHAKILTVFAIVFWVFPFVTIIAPATLSVESVPSSSVRLMPVPTVNFTSFEQWCTYEGAGYLLGPGSAISRLFAQVYTSGRITPQDSPFPNATYELQFWGPSYKCDDFADFINTQDRPTWDPENPDSPHQTFRDAFFAERPYATFDETTDGDMWQAAAPDYMNNILLVHTVGDGGKNNIVCQLYNTSYRISVTFNNSVQSIIPLSIQYLEPAAWNHVVGRYVFLANIRPSEYVGYPDKVLPTFHVTHLLLSNLIVTKMTIGASGTLLFSGKPTASLQQSALPFCPDVGTDYFYREYFNDTSACRNGSLVRVIEDLSRNFTLSTLTYEYWGEPTTTVPVTIQFPQNQYSYQQSTLFMVYGVGFAVTFLCMVMDGIAFKRNGTVSGTAFSTVMLTTRNQDFDSVAVGRWLGSAPLSTDIAKVRMRFGYVSDKDGGAHAGFGLDGTVGPIEDDNVR